MRYFPIILLLSVSLFAYQKGDTLSADIQKKLELTPNKIYIIDFFASWCGSCKKEIPLISLANTKIDPNQAEIIGVDVDKTLEKGLAFQNKLKTDGNLNFRVINDTDNQIVRVFDPLGMPSLYYVRDGKVINMICGALPDIDTKILNDLQELK